MGDLSDYYDQLRMRRKAERAAGRAELEDMAGSSIVPYEMKRSYEEEKKAKAIYLDALERGLSDEQAQQLVEESGVGSVTPNLDRFENQQNLERRSRGIDPDLGGFKTYGDKSAFEAKNAIRKLQGLEPIAEPLPPNKQFLVDLEKSASFGDQSALVGDKAPRGQARAFEAGIRAGYSPEATRKMIADTVARITGVKEPQAAGPNDELMSLMDSSLFGPLVNRGPAQRIMDPSAFDTRKEEPAPSKSEASMSNEEVKAMGERINQIYEQFKSQPPERESNITSRGKTSSDLNVTFGEMPYNEQTSQAEKYRRLLGLGYTPKQAAEILGIPEYKAPAWLQNTGFGSLLESVNKF